MEILEGMTHVSVKDFLKGIKNRAVNDKFMPSDIFASLAAIYGGHAKEMLNVNFLQKNF